MAATTFGRDRHGDGIEVRGQARDGVFAKGPPRLGQHHAFRPTIPRIGGKADQPRPVQTSKRMRHRRLGHLKGPRKVERCLAVAQRTRCSDAEVDTRNPSGSLRSNRLPDNWPMMPTSLKSEKNTAVLFSGPDNLCVQRPARARPHAGPVSKACPHLHGPAPGASISCTRV